MRGCLYLEDIEYDDVDVYITAYQMKSWVENIGRKIIKIEKFIKINE